LDTQEQEPVVGCSSICEVDFLRNFISFYKK